MSIGGRRTREPPSSLLLVHGAGSGPWVYAGWADSFPDLFVSAVDLQAGLDVAVASHDDYACNVVAAAAELPKPVSLCGWSMGGLVVFFRTVSFGRGRRVTWAPASFELPNW